MKRLCQILCDVCDVWRDEMKTFVHDEGIFLFCLLMPAVYPLLYAWIYNNEVVREVPVAVVDDSRSPLSRQFIQMADASPDVHVACRAASLDEARRMIAEQEVRGVYYIPRELADAVYEGRRTFVSVYADMAMTLQYKSLYMTASSVVSQMDKNIRISRMAKLTTARDEDISAAPLRFEEVPIFNPSGGYAGFILPCVLMLVLQQTLMLGIGLSEGTRRERRLGSCATGRMCSCSSSSRLCPSFSSAVCRGRSVPCLPSGRVWGRSSPPPMLSGPMSA